MKKILLCAAAAMTVALSGVSISFAQDDGPPNFVPVLMQVCNYKDGKDSDDFDEAMEPMIEWMEDTDSPPYAGWHVNKWVTGGTQDFDFLFLNAWPGGSAMGEDLTMYVETADDAIEAFDDVADCPANILFGSVMVKSPPESDGQTDGFVLTFTDCNVAEGRSVGDAVRAVREYSEYRTANGSVGGTYVWFPVLGGGDEDFNFKIINSFESVTAYGENYDWNVANQSFRERNRLSAGLLSCNTNRAYIGNTIVNTIATME